MFTDKYISPHFTFEELACRCGCGACDVDPHLVTLAEEIRALLGVPIVVHSCCRCVAHNRAVGGKKGSAHLLGKALDFHASGVGHPSARAALIAAHERGGLPDLGGVGLYPWGLHVDTVKSRDGHLRLWSGSRASPGPKV